jgi:hypothetical protein
MNVLEKYHSTFHKFSLNIQRLSISILSTVIEEHYVKNVHKKSAYREKITKFNDGGTTHFGETLLELAVKEDPLSA